MLSAARNPIVLFGSLHFFPILPHSVMLYAFLRKTNTFLAYLLFLAHFGHSVSHADCARRDAQPHVAGAGRGTVISLRAARPSGSWPSGVGFSCEQLADCGKAGVYPMVVGNRSYSYPPDIACER